MGKLETHVILPEKYEGNRQLGRPTREWDDIKMDRQ
jgi:hypothetical protein